MKRDVVRACLTGGDVASRLEVHRPDGGIGGLAYQEVQLPSETRRLGRDDRVAFQSPTGESRRTSKRERVVGSPSASSDVQVESGGSVIDGAIDDEEAIPCLGAKDRGAGCLYSESSGLIP